jgi:hypothetical protein
MSGVAALRRFASAAPATERCELCSRELTLDHEHLLALERRALACSCGPCALTFDQDARAGARFRRVRRRAERCSSLVLDDALWERLQVPIGLAFFHRTDDGQVVASYPSPAGATESLVPPDAWAAFVAADPRLADLPPAVEAVLVNRARGARTAASYRVSIDRCYALVGLVRARWRGLAGGDEVWRAVEAFFSALEAECPS